MAAFRPWLDDQSAANIPLDHIFNLLHLEYGKEEVNVLVKEPLSASLKINDLGREHGLIRRVPVRRGLLGYSVGLWAGIQKGCLALRCLAGLLLRR